MKSISKRSRIKPQSQDGVNRFARSAFWSARFWSVVSSALPLVYCDLFPFPPSSRLPFSRNAMDCRPQCGACCTAPSITSPIPGMPDGKPAGIRCVQLDDDMLCRIFGRPERPAFCGGLKPSEDMCGASREQAMRWLDALERATAPTSMPTGS
jgi:hypothetical protein